ncbi:DNA-directed DNA polymerase (plasmid) [Mesomycoplasma conjunctivae]|nr:DNA-directed DNA polymerase [Mesomycoplasma conjunctivae]
MSIDVNKKKPKKDDTIKTVLNQTQELVLEANRDADDNFSLEQDLLSSNFEIEEDYDDGLVSTAEIQLDDEIQNMPKPVVIPAFDSKYKNLKTFKSNLSKKDLINLLKQSTLTFLNRYKSNLDIVINTVQNPIYSDLITVLKKCKIAAAGPNYMIFISKNVPELVYLQENGYNSNIQKFIKITLKITNTYTALWVMITKKQQKILQLKWKMQNLTQALQYQDQLFYKM